MERKGRVSTFLVVILVLSFAAISVDATPVPKLFVDPPLYVGSALGEVFQIDINVSDVQDLWGFEFKLAFNTTLLDVQEVIQGPMIPSARFLSSIYETEGYLTVEARVIGFYGVSGNGTLATINFEVTYADSASCILDLSQTLLEDYYEDPITHDVEDGTYKFGLLEITVATDQQRYHQGDTVMIYGNLTLDGEPRQGLVGLQVENSNNDTMILRTVQTGPDPPLQTVSIVDVYTCNTNGVPKEDFKRSPGQVSDYLYVNVTVVNTGATTKNVVIAVNAYDNMMCPVGWTYASKQISPGLGLPPQYSLLSIILPPFASLGSAIVYASVFSDLPRNGGTPYNLEESDTFQIVNSPGGASELPISSTTSADGTFNLTFKLRLYSVGLGNYTVYATSGYLLQQVMSITVFEQYLIGDVDLDGDVDVGDQRKVQLAMFTVPGDPRWNPYADIDGDGDVDVGDQRIQQLYMFTG